MTEFLEGGRVALFRHVQVRVRRHLERLLDLRGHVLLDHLPRSPLEVPPRDVVVLVERGLRLLGRLLLRGLLRRLPAYRPFERGIELGREP